MGLVLEGMFIFVVVVILLGGRAYSGVIRRGVLCMQDRHSAGMPETSPSLRGFEFALEPSLSFRLFFYVSSLGVILSFFFFYFSLSLLSFWSRVIFREGRLLSFYRHVALCDLGCRGGAAGMKQVKFIDWHRR